jgi:hypothetical protein
MKSNHPYSATRHSGSAPVNAPAVSAPSVPISVYRELAAELQTTRAMVDSLNSKAQQLNHENQTLRQEMQRVVYSVLTLQPWLEATSGPVAAPAAGKSQIAAERPTWVETSAAAAIAAKLRTPVEPKVNSQLAEPLFTEERATPYQVTQAKPATKLGGLWLTVIILLIVVSAFGAGFLIMRPFLSSK